MNARTRISVPGAPIAKGKDAGIVWYFTANFSHVTANDRPETRKDTPAGKNSNHFTRVAGQHSILRVSKSPHPARSPHFRHDYSPSVLGIDPYEQWPAAD
jgi:hypothetical protein